MAIFRASKCLYIYLCLLVVALIVGTGSAQTIYPDGGRNVIKMIHAKPTRIIPYNDGSIMTHVIGSAGMNFLYYFHILGVSCENNDPEYYKIIQTDFEFCLNKTGPLPPELRNRPLGSVPKSCYDWKIHKPCYKNLAEDYDECLAGRAGLVKKGTDALRFTHAYFLFICGNIADTEAHLLDRYTKHDLLVPGVFQCFPKLQDRINNCVKRDKISKTLCSKFFIVHACFGKYYNDDNCHDVQPIYYMDDLFRNMSKSLNCPKDENEWINEPRPDPEGGKGWKGWSSREEHSHKENPWPGELGRPWSSEKGKGSPFVRGDGIGWNKNQGHQHQNHNHHGHSHNHNHHHNHHHHSTNDRGWDSGSSERGWSKCRDRLIDPHAHRPLPDTSWNSRPYIDVLDRGKGHSSGYGAPWERGRTSPNSIDSSRGSGGRGVVTYLGRGRQPSQETYSTSSTPRGSSREMDISYTPRGRNKVTYISSTPRGSSREIEVSYTPRGPPSRMTYIHSTPRGTGGGYKKAALPPAGFAITRVPQEVSETDHERFFNTRDSLDPGSGGSVSGEKIDSDHHDNDGDSEKYNFYAFE